MQTQNIVLTIFWVPLFAMLYGCEQKEATQQSSVSAPAAQHVAATTPDGSQIDVMKLAKDIGCLACHALDKKLLGPAWKHVAAINRDIPDAEARLMTKIAKGGSGVWGKIDMPAYPDLSEEKRRILVRFILSLK